MRKLPEGVAPTTDMEKVFRAAKLELSKQLSRDKWQKVPADEKNALAHEVYFIWASPGGPGSQGGWVEHQAAAPSYSEKRAARKRGETLPEFILRPVLVGTPEPTILGESLKGVARAVAKSFERAKGEQEFVGGKDDASIEAEKTEVDDDDDQLAWGAAPETVVAQKLNEQGPSRGQLLDKMEAARAAMARGTSAEQTLGALVDLHFGVPSVPGTPPYFTSTRRASPGRPKESVALLDMLEYHALNRASPATAPGRCPTCKRLARFLRVPGIEEDGIGDVMRNFMMKVRLSPDPSAAKSTGEKPTGPGGEKRP